MKKNERLRKALTEEKKVEKYKKNLSALANEIANEFIRQGTPVKNNRFMVQFILEFGENDYDLVNQEIFPLPKKEEVN